jgi:hypothetical protein
MRDVIEPVQSPREVTERHAAIGLWVRRGIMCVLAAVVVVALCNVVGQRASTARAHTQLGALSLRAPTVVRPGLLFQAKISITAFEPMPATQLVLGNGWVDGLTINTIEPAASSETSAPDGGLVFDLGTIDRGQTFVEYLEFQVNPTSISRRDQTVTVRSQGAVVAALHRTMTIIP